MRHKRNGSSTSAVAVPQQIKYQATDSILPNSRNARTHSARQIQQIARSIERFGFNNPVLVDQNNRVIAGPSEGPAPGNCANALTAASDPKASRPLSFILNAGIFIS